MMSNKKRETEINNANANNNKSKYTGREEIFSTATKKIKLTTQNPLDDKNEEKVTASNNTEELFEIIDLLDKVKDTENSSLNSNAEFEREDKDKLKAISDELLRKEYNTSKNVSYENKQIHTEPENERTKIVGEKHVYDDTVITHGFDKSNESFKAYDEYIQEFSQSENSEINDDTEDLPVVRVSVGKFSQIVRKQYELIRKYQNNGNIYDLESSYNETDVEGVENKNRIKAKIESVVLRTKSLLSDIAHKKPGINHETTNSDIETEQKNEIELERNNAKRFKNTKRVYIKCFLLIILTVALTVIFIIDTFNSHAFAFIESAPRLVISIINLCVLLVGGLIMRETILSGFLAIKRNFGNSNTSISLAYAAVLVQGLYAVIFSNDFTYNKLYLYSPVILLALMFTSLADIFTHERIRNNYYFLKSPKNKYITLNYTDKYQKSQMINGVANQKSDIAYQTKLLKYKRYFTLAYSSGKAQTFVNKTSVVISVISLFTGIVLFVAKRITLPEMFTVFAVINCAGIPLSMGSSIGQYKSRICKQSLKKSAMIGGFNSISQYNNCACAVVDIRSLYPKGALSLKAIRKFDRKNIDDILIKAIAISKTAGSPIYEIFSEIMSDTQKIPETDSVIYEENKGLVGWVNGERILIGSAELLNSHGIDTPSTDYEDKFTDDGENCIVYLAASGILYAMVAVKYRAEERVAKALQALEDAEISILVRSVDRNITTEKIAADFGLFHRSVKILPTALGNTCKQLLQTPSPESVPYLVTNGSFVSMAYGLSLIKRMSGGVKLINWIQIVSIILCLCVTVLLVVYSGMSKLSPLNIMVYFIFWAVMSYIVPLFIKRI